MISVTALNSYTYCKRKLFLEKVLNLFEPPKEATVRGGIRHKVYDLINKAEEQIVKGIERADAEEISNLYKKKHASMLREAIIESATRLNSLGLDKEEIFNEFLPIILEESRLRAENVFNFIKKHAVFGEELWQNLTPKIKSEVRLNSKMLNLVGVVDRLEVYADRVIALELKTGHMPKEGVWPDHKIQLAAYCMLLEENFGKVDSAFVHYLDGNEKRRVSLNPFLEEEILEMIGRVESLLSQKEIPDFTQNKNKCNSCGLKDRCSDEKLLNKRLKEVLTAG